MGNLHSVQHETISQTLFLPLLDALQKAKYERVCTALSDLDWLKTGVTRVLTSEPSGRAFLQMHENDQGDFLKPSHYFETLKSKRRLNLCQEVAESVMRAVNIDLIKNDPFSHTDSLNNYDIYAGDGHYIEHATHDPAIEGTKYACGTLFGLNLRTHTLFPLVNADRSDDRKREHDMRGLKRIGGQRLRCGAQKGRKVIWVWDRAGIDIKQWLQWKNHDGVYFISRAKENMDLSSKGDLPYDVDDPINAGVIAYHLVHVADQVIRCVVYKCPETGREFSYLTSLTTIEPGVVAALYKARWDIEKVFDETKIKLGESKSWASSDTAKAMHSVFVCLTHNLLLRFENQIINDKKVVNGPENTRREKRLHNLKRKAAKSGSTISKLLERISLRCTQRTVKLIRWIKSHLRSKCSIDDDLEALKQWYALG